MVDRHHYSQCEYALQNVIIECQFTVAINNTLRDNIVTHWARNINRTAWDVWTATFWRSRIRPKRAGTSLHEFLNVVRTVGILAIYHVNVWRIIFIIHESSANVTLLIGVHIVDYLCEEIPDELSSVVIIEKLSGSVIVHDHQTFSSILVPLEWCAHTA